MQLKASLDSEVATVSEQNRGIEREVQRFEERERLLQEVLAPLACLRMPGMPGHVASCIRDDITEHAMNIC